MVKKLLILLFTSALAFPLSTPVFAQDAPAKAKAAKEARWEGTVIRSNKDQSTLTVRKVGSSAREDRPVRQLDAMGQSGARQQKGQRH